MFFERPRRKGKLAIGKVQRVGEVYFDDFRVEHVKSPIVSSQDYYPFGLSFGNYQRENSLNNQYQYNGKETQDELSIGWLDYGFRMYQPDLGRFFNIDPHSDSYAAWTPYNYVADNPVLLIDPDGRDWNVNKTEKDGKTNYDITFVGAVVNNSKNATAEDIVNLAVNISNQIQDSFTIDEDGFSTSVSVKLRVSKDGKTESNEHVINVTDDLDSDEAGSAEIGGRTININSNRITEINKTKDADLTTAPHEVGHSAGLVHPDEISWFNMWSWGDRNQMIEEGKDNNNLMYSGPYRQNKLKQDFNNGGKGYKINANQAEIIYQNRDNKPK